MRKLELINIALGGISEEGVTSLSETHPSSLAAFSAFDFAIKALSSVHSWSFLITDKILQGETSDVELYKYRFLIPKNFERKLSVFSDPVNLVDLLANSFEQIPLTLQFYQVRGDYIYSNYDSLQLVYLRNDIENAFLSSGYEVSLIKLTQAEMAISRKNSVTLYNAFMDQANKLLRSAISNDLQQTKTFVSKNNDTISDRNFVSAFRRT